ncbi:MAG: PepSY-associated TM helix domain-containing protein [Azospirillaceae bacterium]|nr:PepSY-associated TM helix domain-containing protein [Azospirillaceae bacterium]
MAGDTGIRLKRWAWVHKWSSLVCTLFLLLICLTGLPLIFAEEINHWLEPHHYADLPADTPRADLDGMVGQARALFPGQVMVSAFIDDDEPQVYLWMAPSWDAIKDDFNAAHFLRFDARTGAVLENSQPQGDQPTTFMEVMLHLHTDLFTGLTGELFLGGMALLFVVAVVSGVVLYAPFAPKDRFGTLRTGRTRRLAWLDTHNLLGVVTLAWALVVGATGVVNELSTPLFGLWRMTDVAEMLKPWQGQPAPAQDALASLQRAFDTATAALPGMQVTSVDYPGAADGSPHHYVLWAKGASPLTSRLFSPVLVDARSGDLSGVVAMPWYLRALEVSRPLHFGDYGGLPLKILWALLDLVTIVVLGSGLYLWLVRRVPAPVRAPADALPSTGD